MQIRDGQIDHALHSIRVQAVPAFQALQGCRNVSVLVDREAYRIAFVTQWDTREQAWAASEDKYRLDALHRVEPDLAGAPDTRVYEVAFRG